MIELNNRALLAPMSGITDLPFRRLAYRLGAGVVVAEMVASHQLAKEDHKTLQRATGCNEIRPHVIQITGRDKLQMAEAARIAAGLGADMIDINMGCPSRKVTNGLAGSALMKEPILALGIIEAVVGAVNIPVSLKMRLGWDSENLTAALIAKQAEKAGVVMFVVHGRTRCQFYRGKADWRAIGEVAHAVSVPVFANGDITSFADARMALTQSGTYGVMIGRAAQGRPWFVGQVDAALAGRCVPSTPTPSACRKIILAHYEDMLSHYGKKIGVRIARKHLGWYLENLLTSPSKIAQWRTKLCREEDPRQVIRQIERLFMSLQPQCEAAL